MIPARVVPDVPTLAAASPVVLLVGVRGGRGPGTAVEVAAMVGVGFLVPVVPVLPAA